MHYKKEKIGQRDSAICSHSEEITTTSYYGLGRPSYFKVMLHLCLYLVKDGWACAYQSRDQMAKSFKTPKGTVRNAICAIKKLGLIESERTRRISGKVGGSMVNITITEKGRLWYEEFKIAMEKRKIKERKEDLKLNSSENFEDLPPAPSKPSSPPKYTPEDEQVALHFFKTLKKYYKNRTSQTIFKKLNWGDSKGERSNTIRKIRESENVTHEQMIEVLDFVGNDTFFMENCWGPNSLTKKWKNGSTVFQNMCNRFDSEQIKKQQREESKKGGDIDLDMLFEEAYYKEDQPDDSEWVMNEIHPYYLAFVDMMGDRFKTHYHTQEEADEAAGKLLDLFETIAYTARATLRRHCYNLDSLSPKSKRLLQQVDAENDGSGVFWAFVLDKNKDWEGNFTLDMITRHWLEFCGKATRQITGEEVDDYPEGSFEIRSRMDDFFDHYNKYIKE